MSSLHELLGAKVKREPEANGLMDDHTKKFKADLHLFSAMRRDFTPSTEEAGVVAKTVTEEEKPLVTTVKKELDFVLAKLIGCVDLNYTIDVANCSAAASIEIDGKVFGDPMPVTFLMYLEKQLGRVLALVQFMATADPVAGYKQDPNQPPNVLVAKPDVKDRTKKITKYITVAQATDKHPAQVVPNVEDVKIGVITTTTWTSLPTVHQKAEMLARLSAVTEAVIRARQRANQMDIQQKKIFGDLMAYVTEPLTK